MRVVASEAFKINVRPSTNFQRMLAGGNALSSSTEQLQQFPKEGSTSTHTSISNERLPAASAPSEAPGHSRHSSYGSDVGGGPVTSEVPVPSSRDGGPILAALSHGMAGGSESGALSSREMSPQSTPLSTPTLHRRDDAFAGPTLNLFERKPEPLPPSQSFPGRQALPVANLMSFQSAMLGEVTAQREAEREERREALGEQERAPTSIEAQQDAAASKSGASGRVGSFLWPTSVNLPGLPRRSNSASDRAQ
jgi:hypothetical protein